MANATTPAIQINEGNVGIGTTSPSQKLDVNGRVRIGDVNYSYGGQNFHIVLAEDTQDAYITNIEGYGMMSAGGYYYGANLRQLNSNSTAYSAIHLRTNGDIVFENITGATAGSTASANQRMIINTSGNVGIGTTNPTEKLNVSGNILATGTITGSNLSGTNTGDQDLSGYLLNTTVATNTTLGLIELFSNTDQTVAANAVTTTAGRTYGLQLNSANQGVINVPWTDTNTTYSAGTGLSLAGTQFSLGTGGIGAGTYGSTADGTKIDTIAVDAYGRVTGIATGPTGSIGTSGFTMNDGAQIKTYQDTNSGSSQSAATLITENDIDTGGCINWWSEIQNGSFGTYNHAVFYHGTSQAGAIRRSGNTTVSYITSSDYRLKENVVEITDGIERVKQLKPSKFNFIGEDRIVDGFLAHEVQGVVPESISGEKDEVDNDGNPVYQGIDQSKIVPLLAGALKEAISKIEQLETRIQTLENKQL
jgi:hypothetical protein